MDTNTVLKEYIRNDILRNRNARLDDDIDLINSGIIDSLDILQLIEFIQKSYNIEIPDVDVMYENFYSINAMSSYLQQYQ